MKTDGFADGFAIFDSPIGRCGIAWAGRRVSGVQLPERDDATTRARVEGRFPGALESAPPLEVERAVDGIRALLRGELPDLSGVALDMTGVPEFHREDTSRHRDNAVAHDHNDARE